MGNLFGRMCVEVGGEVYCWGNNANGELGDGSTVERHTAVLVANITTATSVSAGHSSHSCATLADGTVQCWGRNDNGQLGDGTTTDRLTPVLVSNITTATSVSTGGGHACATLADGTVQCWGGNVNGQLGDGTTTNRLTPVLVSGITTATSVSAGGFFLTGFHTCATLADGTVQCWGANANGQLGDGTTTDRLTPVLVSGITTATSVSAGALHNCAMLADGTVQCWGGNGKGQLGDGTTTSSNIPVQVLGIVPGIIVPLRSADTLSDVEIAGIAVGCIAFVIILTLIGLCVRSRRRADDKLRARGAPVAVTPQQPQVIVIQT